MTGNFARLLCVTGVALAATFSANAALADECSSAYRTNYPSCVTVTTGSKSVFAKNQCEGVIHLKVDKKLTDDLLELTDSSDVSKSYKRKVKKVYCCTQLGDGCDQKLLTATSCLDNYNESSASEYCKDSDVSQSGRDCTITASCRTGGRIHETRCRNEPIFCLPGNDTCTPGEIREVCTTISTDEYKTTEINVKTIDAGDVYNCRGALTTGSC